MTNLYLFFKMLRFSHFFTQPDKTPQTTIDVLVTVLLLCV